MKRWVARIWSEKEQKQISESMLIVYFLDKVGTDMENIQGELEKLFCYTQWKVGYDYEVEDVEAVCVTQITNHIFDMVNAAAEGRSAERHWICIMNCLP